MSKQYSVRNFVSRSKEDREEVEAILAKHPLWKEKHARDLLARTRFQKRIDTAASKQETA